MSFYPRQYRFGFGSGMTEAVKYLLIINIGIFILQNLAPVMGLDKTFGLGLKPYDINHKFAIWQFFTYMFLHGNFLHLLFNMLVLWLFGSEIEKYWGSSTFLKYFFLTGIGGGLCFYLFNLGAGPELVTVGASGALYGLMVAFAIMFPDRYITLLLFFVLPFSLRARYLVIIMVGIDLFLAITSSNDGVAHLAHLGGAAFGFIYLRWDAIFSQFKKYNLDRQRKAWLNDQERLNARSRREQEQRERHQAEKKVRQQEIDVLLDKINEIGYDNLTEKEKQRLREASQFLSDE